MSVKRNVTVPVGRSLRTNAQCLPPDARREGRRAFGRSVLLAGAAARLAAVARPVGELAEDDHRQEDQADDQHAEDDVRALAGGVEDHAENLAECSASARRTSASPNDPPSARAASTQASPSPPRPSARSAAQRAISSASTATAGTPPASAIRTSPCA